MNLANYLWCIAGITAFSVLCFGLPLAFADSAIALGYVAGVPPQLFVTLSWVLAYEYCRRNCPEKTLLLSFGMIPVRFVVEVAWFGLLWNVEQVNIGVAVGSAIMHFALFSVPQILTINSLCAIKPKCS